MDELITQRPADYAGEFNALYVTMSSVTKKGENILVNVPGMLK